MTSRVSRGTVLLIDHPVGQRDDRASRSLTERGYRLEWRCPGKGDPLPGPGADYAAVVVYGGTENLSRDEAAGDKAYLRNEIEWIEGWVAKDRPFLGICLGAQLLARALGAPVKPHPEGLHEIGFVRIKPAAAADGFLSDPLHVYHWHQEGFEVPREAELLASGPTFPNQAFCYGSNTYGIQFHPEVSPQVIARWSSEAEPGPDHRPGAHPRARQLADAELYDAEMSAWFEVFLDRWLG
jgi:GMP synthase (glutamine-hydrolysing)